MCDANKKLFCVVESPKVGKNQCDQVWQKFATLAAPF